MKKQLAIVITCIAFMTSLVCARAISQDLNIQQGLEIVFNGEMTGDKSIVKDSAHYVPMRSIFEKMGASVFYRSSDNQILALARNGDIIRHIIGDSIVTVNEVQMTFNNSSVLENGNTYIPIDMVSAIFYPDAISYENQKLNIQKQFLSNDYHKIIKDVLDVCRNSNFDLEKFQRYINFHASMPSYSIEDVIFRVNLGLDYPFYENMTTIEHPHELLVLVNKYNKLPAGFNQYDLVNVDAKYTYRDGKTYLLTSEAYEKYIQMHNAAKKDGLSIKIVSSYRTEDYQQNLYNRKVRAAGKSYADKYSARPGHSEHQTGLAIDLNHTNLNFEKMPEFRWLQKHAHEFGYIMRYPKGKEWITGYGYEPWHYRYVGTDVAKIIYEECITFEEYYAKHISKIEFR